MDKESKELFIEGAKSFGIYLNEKLIIEFEIYLKELLKWNKKINLTAIRAEKDIILKHFLDSLSVVSNLPPVSNLLDIGSGAGFPGIPLKMVLPSIEITLIDSRIKKVDFQRHVIRILGLKGIEAIHGRIEEGKIIEKLEGRFDAIISRAFSDIGRILCLGLPYLRKEGFVLTMKGRLVQEEIRSILKKKNLPYTLKKESYFYLPFSSYKRSILIFKKDH